MCKNQHLPVLQDPPIDREHHSIQVRPHFLLAEAQEANAQFLKTALTHLIIPSPQFVTASVDLDGQQQFWGEEVHDELIDRTLAVKVESKPPLSTQLLP